eukprot:TRINITY_DN28755_c0_g1_i2.p1 TRINITY_DN28755_c0_g1~~TRINITY_DN28755_c0_g1_i2.p1  ORF type:complete len:731 (+),score=172.08 TRINITY_DN28755_c0_g1_i2:37-2193(+)
MGERLRMSKADLAAYYGLAQGAVDDSNIDSPHFNASKYTQKFLKESTLEEIMKRDMALANETRKIDKELQTLVYDNYNKFISATETIRKMAENVGNMEAQMTLLQEKMQVISTCTTEIAGNLHGRRQEVEQLNAVQNMLKKIQFLIELPQRLRGCMGDAGAYSVAVRYYITGTRILGKYSHIKSFNHIRDECNQVIGELKLKLWEGAKGSLNDPEAMPRVRECVQLLLQLDGEDEKVRSELRNLLTSPVFSKLTESEAAFFASLEAAKNVRCSRDAVERLPPGEVFTPKLNVAERFLTLHDVLSTFDTELTRAHSVLQEPRHRASEERVTAMQSLLDRAIAAFSHALLDLTKTRLQHCLARFIDNRLPHLPPHATTVTGMRLYDAVKQAAHLLVEDWEDLNRQATATAENFRLPPPELATHLSGFLRDLNTYFAEFCQPLPGRPSENDKRRHCNVLLGLSLIAHRFSSGSGVKDLVRVLSESSGLHVETLQKPFEPTLKTLMHAFTRNKGQVLSGMIKAGIDSTDWMACKEPQDVRVMATILVDELTATDALIVDGLSANAKGQTIHDGRSDSGSEAGSTISELGGVAYHPQFSLTSTQSITVEIAKIFDKTHTFVATSLRPRTLSRPVLMDAVLNYTFKSFLECVRLKVFGRAGFQQLQVDTQYIRVRCMPYTKRTKTGKAWLNEAMDEIILTVFDRCVDKQALPPEKVDEIIHRKA